MGIQYREYGDKTAPAFLFIHGGGVSGWMWDQQIEHFSNYHCIIPNLPEHGLANNDVIFSIESSAKSLIALIEEKAQNKEVIVTGFSLGAQVLVQMLSEKPDLIDMAIINSALVRPNPTLIKWMEPMIRWTFPLIKNRRFAKLQAKTLYIKENNFEKYYKESCQISRETLIRVLKENMAFKIPDNFHQVETRMLITVGQKEKSIMKKSAQDLVAANKNCTGIVLKHIGHGVSLANPEVFHQIVESWLEKNELSGVKEAVTYIKS
ncbi:Pimeloyl-ACP methyl ester carboxylesterase [Gracilibacillus ureilyticus]|uniref:Pimeloyl-ACP methyl ester carboxylesterase n=1 Tax=Gracilibacillus ureilyticus TaxID=531814 RepID=A0A1H9VV37_9BACI|nr:alpha/beta hydrolase [Gracilibacillus ureilyticus]SES25399.1 Pimeloyl-ACP methyl ester carboxylesterase [Gracilibacillus ureilyticus]